MQINEAIKRRADKRGISCAELARRTGMKSELLRRSLKNTRKFRAEELINVCAELEIGLSDLSTEARQS